MAKVIWTGAALNQLEAIIEVIALDKPGVAAEVAQDIIDATDRIEYFKMLGRKIPEFPNPNYRQVYRKPCWIYYRIEGDNISILHVRRAEQLFRIESLAGDL